MLRKIILALLLLIIHSTAYSIPAKPNVWRMITLPDGSNVKAILSGDEFEHYWQTENGNRYIETSQGLVPLSSKDISSAMASRTILQQPSKSMSYKGTHRALIILVNFKDNNFSVSNPQVLFDDIANTHNYSNGDFRGSVSDYFYSQSHGMFNLEFDVVGPVTLQHEMKYYGADCDKGIDSHPEEMVREACKNIESIVNFSDYDWDDDGEVEQVFVLYAGYGESEGGSADTVWPHKSKLSYKSRAITVDGVKVDTYACSNELQNSSGNKLCGIGTICHEFSHCLGLPDLYDTSTGKNPYLGHWDLMAAGNYDGDEYCPCGYSAYERYAVGWTTPEVISDYPFVVNDVKPLSDNGDSYILYTADEKDDAYIFENRQQTGWDACLPGSGLLVTHVNYDVSSWLANEVNVGSDPHLVYLQAAQDKESHYAYPYKELDSLMIMHYMVNDISISSSGNASFSISEYADNTEPGDTLFYESFDNCKGNGGNDNRWNGALGNSMLKYDNYGWSNSYGYGGDKCARYGKTGYYDNITSPEIDVNGSAMLSFRAGAWNAEKAKDGTDLELSIENGILGCHHYTINKGAWTNCSSTISAHCKVRITFSPDCRLFLDEITVTKVNAASSIKINTCKDGKTIREIYSIDGCRKTSLGKGLNIIRYSDGSTGKVVITK